MRGCERCRLVEEIHISVSRLVDILFPPPRRHNGGRRILRRVGILVHKLLGANETFIVRKDIYIDGYEIILGGAPDFIDFNKRLVAELKTIIDEAELTEEFLERARTQVLLYEYLLGYEEGRVYIVMVEDFNGDSIEVSLYKVIPVFYDEETVYEVLKKFIRYYQLEQGYKKLRGLIYY